MQLLFFTMILFFSTETFSQNKMMMEEPLQKKYSDSLQVILVTTKKWNSFKGKAQLYERQTIKSNWIPVGKEFQVVVGKKGLSWSKDTLEDNETQATKKEGDKKSPAGIFMLTSVFSPREVNSNMPFTKIIESTECVDDIESRHYNKIVDRNRVGIFDWKSSEKMLEVGELYELGVFVSYNPTRIRGDGSCVFLHVWRNSSSGTAGCTAMEKSKLERIVKWLDSSKNPFLIQLPETAYKKYQKSWNLP